MLKILLFSITFLSILNSAVMEEGEFYKEKQELVLLKKELNEFYEKKELKYQEQKKELEDLLASIQKEKKIIEDTKKANKEQIDEINHTVNTRAITMYNKMKVKVVLDVFNTMLSKGKINEVFDIIIRLKQKRVMEILKKLDVNTKTILMDKINKYNFEEKNKQAKETK